MQRKNAGNVARLFSSTMKEQLLCAGLHLASWICVPCLDPVWRNE